MQSRVTVKDGWLYKYDQSISQQDGRVIVLTPRYLGGMAYYLNQGIPDLATSKCVECKSISVFCIVKGELRS